MYIKYSVYSFIDGPRLFTPFGYCGKCCYEHGVKISPRDPAFDSFTYIPRCRIAGSYDSSIFNSSRSPAPIPLSPAAAPSYVPTDRARGSPLVHILTGTLFYGCRPNGCQVISTNSLSELEMLSSGDLSLYLDPELSISQICHLPLNPTSGTTSSTRQLLAAWSFLHHPDSSNTLTAAEPLTH